MDVFTNPEVCQTSYFGDFMRATSCRYYQLLTPFIVPLPSPENGGVELKVPDFKIYLVFPVTSPIQEPSKSNLIRIKDVPITQEI